MILVWFFIDRRARCRSRSRSTPGCSRRLSPTWAARFMVDHGVDAWLTLGGVVLCVTGAEALYADRGHFGAGPIRVTWFAIVLPAVLLNYLGQSAAHPPRPCRSDEPVLPAGADLGTPAARLPGHAGDDHRLPGGAHRLVLGRQAGRPARLPAAATDRAHVRARGPDLRAAHQLARCARAWSRSCWCSAAPPSLADIYGVAVTGTFILDTTLFLAVARSLWKTPKWQLALLGAVFYIVEVSFFTSNLTKVAHGAWLPLARRADRGHHHGHLAQGPRHPHAQPDRRRRARWTSSWTACATPSRRSCACPAPRSSSTPARRRRRWRCAPRSSTTTPSTRRW